MIPKFETNYNSLMSRHFDIIDVHAEVIKDYDFRQISKFQEYDEVEKHFFFYHKDHLGSSTQISNIDANIIHHIEYMPSGEQFSEQHCSMPLPYKFNSKELDAETGLYYYGARYYTPEIGIWLSVDPMSDKYPSLSPYAYCANNPVMLVDPDGRDIDPSSPGYEEATNAATPGHDSYQPAFAKQYNDWNKDGGINVKFNNSMDGSKSPNDAGTIEYGGTDNGGENGSERDVYNVFWDSSESTTNALGTSAMFEESQHLKDGLDGKFNIKSGCAGFGIMNEVEAKQWVVDNISGIKDKYDNGGFKERTHYGYFKDNPKELTPKNLGLGVGLTSTGKDARTRKSHTLFGTGGNNYKKLYHDYIKKQK